MQKPLFSSLFFHASFLIILYVPKQGIGQEQSDSTTYYYTRILQPGTQEETQKSMAFFKKQLQLYQGAQNRFYRASILELIALGEFNQGELFKSETSAIESYKVLEHVAPTEETQHMRVRLANHLGRIYRRLGDPSKALLYYTETLPITTTRRDRLILVNNIAAIYIDEGAYQKAEELLKPLVEDLKFIEGNKEQATLLDNYGFTLLQLGDPQGIDYINKSLVINTKIAHTQGLYSNHKRSATYYTIFGEKEAAKLSLLKAKKIASQIDNPTFELEVMGMAIEMGEVSDALPYKRLSEHLKKERQKVENKYTAQKYNYEQIQSRAQENERIAQREIEKNYWFKFLLGTIILLFAAIVIIIRTLAKKKNVEQIFKTEARLAKKVHDEVSNDVYKVMTQLQQQGSKNPNILDHLETIYVRSRDISRKNSAIAVDRDFKSTLNDLLLAYRTDELNIITKYSEGLRWNKVAKTKKMTIYRVLQELVTNTIKHGKASTILIICTQKKKVMHIDYSDNGVGGALSHKNGLQNVETRILSHKGRITFESESHKGFRAHIQI